MLSVIIPCLNTERVLPAQLEALARQQCSQPWEVIVADNGSVDRTREVALSFLDRLPHLQVISAEPRGRHHACNAGARSARNDYFVFVDADDEVAQGFLESMLRGLQAHDLVGGKLEHRRLNAPSFRNVGEVQSAGLMEGLGVGPFVMGANMGVTRALFERLGGFHDKPYCEDIDFCWRALLMGVHPIFLPDAVVHYRQRPTAISMFRQHRRFGAAHALLYRDYRMRGMRRRPAAKVVREWLTIGKSLPLLPHSTPDVRLRWLRRLGRAVGRLSGSVRYRAFYP